jgi:hypothetical protein
VPPEAEGALTMQTLTTVEREGARLAQVLLQSGRSNQFSSTDGARAIQNGARIASEIRRQQDGYSEVADRIVFALSDAGAAIASASDGDFARMKSRLNTAARHLDLLSRIAKLPKVGEPTRQQPAQSRPKEPRSNPKVLAQYAENFKKAQEGLETPRATNDQGWTRTAKPHGAAGVLQRDDDQAYEIRWDPSEVERIERRDAQAIRDWAAGYRPPCPIATYEVRPDGPDRFSIHPYVKDAAGDMRPVGALYAARSGDDRTRWISGSADVPIETLAACPGLGNSMYLEAANEACKRRGRLTGSDMRSVFSEHFWKKQIEKGRAECSGSMAYYYATPLRKALLALRNGKITVPQYNALRARMPEGGDQYGQWACKQVPLNREWCKTPKKKRTLRGVQGSGRYRLTSGKG